MITCTPKEIKVSYFEDLHDREPKAEKLSLAHGRVMDHFNYDWLEGSESLKDISVVLNEDAFLPEQVKNFTASEFDSIRFYKIPRAAALVGITGVIAAGSSGTAGAGATAGVLSLLGGAALGLLKSLAVSAIFAGISYAITEATKPDSPKFNDSPTYGFDGIQNTVRTGTRIPTIYGTHRVGGHILASVIAPRIAIDELQDISAENGALYTLLGIGSGGQHGIESIDEVELDGNPVENFTGVKCIKRLGKLHQAAIPGFNDQKSQSIKDVDLTQNNSVTYETLDEVDAFQVSINMPNGMFRVTTGGSVRDASATIQVEYRLAGSTGNWHVLPDTTIFQTTRSPFTQFIESPRLERAKYEIRVTRTSIDSQGRTTSHTRLLGITDIVAEEQSYPGEALLGVIQIPTSQLSGQAPLISALVKGRKVRVYSDPNTFTVQWSDNPAWCLADFLTDKENGLGAFFNYEENIHIQEFIDYAQHCDELVPIKDGQATEKRATLNMVVDGSLSTLETMQQMVAVGQAFLRLSDNQIGIKIDRDEVYKRVFTLGRIRKNSFQVSIPSAQDRPNYFLGQFWDEEIGYDENWVPLADPLSKNPEHIEEEVSLVGVTKATHVQRILSYYILGARLNRRIVEFGAFHEALGVEAGDLIRISHDVPGWGKSGTFVAIHSSGVVLDQEVTLEAGKEYELTIPHTDGTASVVKVTTPSDTTTNKLTFSAQLPEQPKKGGHFAFGEVGKSTVTYRVLSIVPDPDNPIRSKIVAREHNPAVYGDELTALPSPSITTLPDPKKIPPDVSGLRVAERQEFAEDGTLTTVLDVHFHLPASPGISAQIFMREAVAGARWIPQGETRSGNFVIRDNIESPGVTYEITVLSVSALGVMKSPEFGPRVTVTTVGSDRQPDDVTGFTVDRTSDGLVFSWDPIDPIENFDLREYEIREGADWFSAQIIGRSTGTSLRTTAFVRSLSGSTTYQIRAINAAGVYSANSDTAVLFVEPGFNENVILTRDEKALSWPGSLDGSAQISATNLVFTGADGEYESPKFEITSGSAVRTLVSNLRAAVLGNLSLTWDNPDVGDQDWNSLFAQNTTWEEGAIKDQAIKLEMRFSTTDSLDASFGAWQERQQNFEVKAKWVQFRIKVFIEDENHVVTISSFILFFDVPDIRDSGKVTTSAAGTTNVPFNQSYTNAPKVVASIENPSLGEEVVITNITSTSFDLSVRDSGGTLVSRSVNWFSHGF